jgi:hypothetical protein
MPTQSRPSTPRAFAGYPGADTEEGSLDMLTRLDQGWSKTANQARSYTLICEEPERPIMSTSACPG